MGIIKRQASKSTITSLVGVIVSASSAIFIIPTIPKEIYGMVSIVIGIASLLLPITLLGLNSSLLRFSETIDKLNDKELFFRKLYKIQTLTSIVICSFFFLLSEKFFETFYPGSAMDKNAGLCISILIFLMGQFTMLSAYATTKYRLNVTRIAELVFQKAGIPLLLFVSVITLLPIDYILPGILILYFFRAFSLWFFRLKTKPKNISNSPKSSSKISLWPYSVFALFAVLIHQATIDIDTLMVGSLISVGEAGVYKYAFFIGMIVDLPRLNLVALLFPLISKYQAKNDRKGIDSVYKRSSNLLYILGSFFLILIIPNLDDFFDLIPNGEIFKHAKLVIVFISLSKLFNMAMGVNFEIIASSKNYVVIIFINLLTLGVVILSNNLLIPIYGISGAALATLAVWLTYNIFAFIYLKIAFDYSPFSKTTLKITGLLIVFIGLFYFIPVNTPYSMVNISVRSTFSVLFLFVCFKLSLSMDFNSQCINALKLLKIIKK